MRSPLIAVSELQRRLADASERPALLDVRWELGAGPGRDRYQNGHIPGAAFVDLDRQLAGEPGAGERHPLPAAAQFAAGMQAAGVADDRAVVVYDAASSMAAARAWWLLRYFGHGAVTVLDGGLAAWVAAGGPLATGAQTAESGDFTARPGAMGVLDAAGALALAQRGVLLDARAPERFRGETEPVDPVAGHIPGARNRPTTLNLEASGRFRDPAALRTEFEQAGVGDQLQVGAYCGSGVSAAHEVLALELAGVQAALYPGSWSEWITDPTRPVATGTAQP
jgi:thiosulfate/3-mercaptopyruvate sulfurtransferase